MRRRQLTLLAGAAATALAGTALVVLPNVAQAAAGCQVTYTTNDWQGGFTASVNVTNLGDPVTAWTLKFAFPNGQTVAQGWSANWTQSGADVTATNLSWNGALGTNASTSLGFNGTWTGSNGKPTAFTLNGVACNGTTTPNSPSPSPTRNTSPSPSVSPSASTSPPPQGGAAPALHVSGNKLLTASGAAYRLLGVNRSGGEFACIQGNGIWDGPMDQASITAMRTWKIRTVRVPLNEQCWLGVAPVPAQYGGTTYQNAVKAYVNLLIANGITPIVEMHWNYGQYTGPSSGCTDVNATCQKPMPDAQYAPSFWTGVANAFKGNNAVVFDLFNEPYPERATGSTTTGWTCWRDGGTCSGIPYQVAGFQTLVNAVRATGATNVVMLGGLAYSNDASQWLQYKPTDPTGNLAAFAHVYNFNTCSTTSCYDSTFAPVAAQVPFNFTEIGENDCGHSFIDTLMNWADAHNVGYLGWTWNTWDCSTGPSLISDFNGTATAFGQGLKSHLATVSN
jgi:endoglucanase